jgi:hypothetical protein
VISKILAPQEVTLKSNVGKIVFTSRMTYQRFLMFAEIVMFLQSTSAVAVKSINQGLVMKLNKKVFFVAVLLGLSGGLIGTTLDYLFFHTVKDFWDLLIFDVPRHSLYFRSVILSLFIVFGIIMGNVVFRLEEALQNVKTLRGMLPICSNCKKIRDDEGYWQQIEEYVRVHSEADFTHGICNECVEKLYPEYYQQFAERMKEKDSSTDG